MKTTAHTVRFATTAKRKLPGAICVAIQANSPAEMLQRAAAASGPAASGRARFLEFRFDSLPRPGAVLPNLKKFLVASPNVIGLATCRRQSHGGSFTGDLATELDILLKAARAGCRIVDLEVESAEEAESSQLEKFRASLRSAGAELLISFHDFSRTRGLEDAAERIARYAPDYMKVVSTAQTLADNLAILRLIESRSIRQRIVGIAMGEEGLVSRVLGPREGAAFTFASMDEANAGAGMGTAPGQVSARKLRELYRLGNIDAETRVFGVGGNPIAHSLSPLLHNTAFASAGVNAVLLPLKVRDIADLLTLMVELPMSGAAITMPLKQQVLPYLAQMDALTERIGACNTLRVSADGKLSGFNTDVAGVVRPLEKRIKLKGSRVIVLGAGGAARAAVFGLVDQGAEVFVVNRTHEHAIALAKAAKATPLRQEKLAHHACDVLINATPCGMAGSSERLPLHEDQLNAGMVFDMVYNPLQTPLLLLAKSRGIPIIGGIEMFVQQGARQFEIWTGKTPPEELMQRVILRELRRRAGGQAPRPSKSF